jgi:hypothetical protein
MLGRSTKMMRITLSTPSFDSTESPWDRVQVHSDGRFYQYGSRGINKHDKRLTYVLISDTPCHLVSVSGRSLNPKQKHADFLSLRIGADKVKLITLSLETTKFITILADGKILTEKRKVVFSDFINDLPQLVFDTNSKELSYMKQQNETK